MLASWQQSLAITSLFYYWSIIKNLLFVGKIFILSNHKPIPVASFNLSINSSFHVRFHFDCVLVFNSLSACYILIKTSKRFIFAMSGYFGGSMMKRGWTEKLMGLNCYKGFESVEKFGVDTEYEVRVFVGCWVVPGNDSTFGYGDSTDSSLIRSRWTVMPLPNDFDKVMICLIVCDFTSLTSSCHFFFEVCLFYHRRLAKRLPLPWLLMYRREVFSF